MDPEVLLKQRGPGLLLLAGPLHCYRESIFARTNKNKNKKKKREKFMQAVLLVCTER